MQSNRISLTGYLRWDWRPTLCHILTMVAVNSVIVRMMAAVTTEMNYRLVCVGSWVSRMTHICCNTGWLLHLLFGSCPSIPQRLFLSSTHHHHCCYICKIKPSKCTVVLKSPPTPTPTKTNNNNNPQNKIINNNEKPDFIVWSQFTQVKTTFNLGQLVTEFECPVNCTGSP